jgi:hypothetical protein
MLLGIPSGIATGTIATTIAITTTTSLEQYDATPLFGQCLLEVVGALL